MNGGYFASRGPGRRLSRSSLPAYNRPHDGWRLPVLPPQRLWRLGGRLCHHLALRYGEDGVWQDVDNLTVGGDYLPQILQNIAAADAVLIVIGPHWLDELPQRGKTRLANPKDVLRTEIVHALKKKSVSSRRSLAARQCPTPEICPAPSRRW